MKVRMKIIEKALGDMSIKTQRRYTGTGLDMREVRVVQTESDFNASTDERFSTDNGRTWTRTGPISTEISQEYTAAIRSAV